MYVYLAKISAGAVDQMGEYIVRRSAGPGLPLTKMYLAEWAIEISPRGKHYIKNRYGNTTVEFSDEEIMMMTLKARPV